MLSDVFLKEAKYIEEIIINHRRFLHQNPETGFDISNTVDYVRSSLKEIGCVVKKCGKNGLETLIGKNDNKVFLLRADMDALPMEEETDLDFKSINGNMHACGHDMHTAMLLGAAQILKKYEDKIKGTVKLMFQPAEEILEGSKDMLHAGILEGPKVDAGLMIHVMVGVPIKAGTVIVSNAGNSAPSADYFEIIIQGKGSHGSSPHTGIDPINVAAHLVIALQEITTRELPMREQVILTVGQIAGGKAANVIPDKVCLKGSLRTFREETREYVKKRIVEISTSVSDTFRATSNVEFTSGCPPLKNDKDLVNKVDGILKELLGKNQVYCAEDFVENNSGGNGVTAGSEDFAYISQEIPTVMIALAAGEPKDGHLYPIHHPKVTFDEGALVVGSAVYAYAAIKWLENN